MLSNIAKLRDVPIPEDGGMPEDNGAGNEHANEADMAARAVRQHFIDTYFTN